MTQEPKLGVERITRSERDGLLGKGVALEDEAKGEGR